VAAAAPEERRSWGEADTVTLRGHDGPVRTYTTIDQPAPG
jgi:class 3 adenylate cyclase